MNAQVQRLIVLQELDAMLDDLGHEGAVEEGTLGLTVQGLRKTRKRRESIAKEVDEKLLARYVQVRRRHKRAVAELRDNTCLGCFTRRPTASWVDRGGLQTCERCGRILFRREEPAPPLPEPRGTSPSDAKGSSRRRRVPKTRPPGGA